MATDTTRKPRPMGLTQLSLAYQKDPSDENLLKLHFFLLNQWYINTGNICGVSYDINSLSGRFNIPKAYINTFMRDVVMSSKIWDQTKQEEILNGLLGEQLTWALEDRMEIVNQVNILKASQNGKYTPFISAELNKALKLRLDSSASLQSLIRGFTSGSGGTLNIFQQFNQQNNVQEAEYITIEEARQIIQDSNQLEDKSAEAKYLEAKYDIEALPEVVATKQIGVDTSREGLNTTVKKAELESITDDYKGAIEASHKEHHQLRREIEQRIDPYEPDPELAFYEEEDKELTLEQIAKSPYLN